MKLFCVNLWNWNYERRSLRDCKHYTVYTECGCNMCQNGLCCLSFEGVSYKKAVEEGCSFEHSFILATFSGHHGESFNVFNPQSKPLHSHE